MLDVHCDTVRGEGDKGTGTHTHWHVNVQADGIGSGGSVSLPGKPGLSLGHKTKISILGSKRRLNLQGQHASLAREGGLPSVPREAQPDRRVQSPRNGGGLVAAVPSVHRPAEDSSREEMRGHHQLTQGRGAR